MLRAALVITAVVGVAVVVFGLRYQSALEGIWDVSRLTADNLPKLLQRIRDFRRVITRDGLTVLEVSAKKADFF